MKNLKLFQKVNNFYKIATTSEKVQQAYTYLDNLISMLDYLVKYYSPQANQNNEIRTILPQLSQALTFVQQMRTSLGKGISNVDYFSYLAKITNSISQYIKSLYDIEKARNPSLAGQLNAAQDTYSKIFVPYFNQLTQEYTQLETPNANKQADEATNYYKNFFENFTPEQIGKFLNLKGPNIEFFNITDSNVDVNSLPAQQQPIIKGFFALTPEKRKDVKQKIKDGNDLYRKNIPANALGSAEKRKHLQSLSNQFLEQKGWNKYVATPTGTFDQNNQFGIQMTMKLLELPSSTSIEQLYEKLKQMFGSNK